MTTPSTNMKCRFAPSPNGYLHKGHGYSALLNARAAAKCGGTFFLRIEDIDQTRCKPSYTNALFEDLHWLGLTWDQDIWVQSKRFAIYGEALERLDRMGLLYRCYATRGEIKAAIADKQDPHWPTDPDGTPLYPALFKNLSTKDAARIGADAKPFALRLHMDRALETIGSKPLKFDELSQAGKNGTKETIKANPALWGDVILARKDTPTSYHLACTLDDALQDITHVIRGKELQAATSIHVVLQRLLNLPTPLYFHHNLILDEQGVKLAKSAPSQGASLPTSLRDLRLAGESSSTFCAQFDLSSPLSNLSCA